LQRDFERKEHERRVWEMLLSMGSAINSSEITLTPGEVLNAMNNAEKLVAGYERRMKEQKEGENGHD